MVLPSHPPTQDLQFACPALSNTWISVSQTFVPPDHNATEQTRDLLTMISGSATTSRKVDFIGNLPTELARAILTHCCYQDLLMLCMVSRGYNEFVDPQDAVEEDKVAFVKLAQNWPKHNRCHITFENGHETLKRDVNSFACYLCYRVLPQEEFSRRQTVKRYAKNSPFDGLRPQRACIQCCLNWSLYCHGTKVECVRKVSESLHTTRHRAEEVYTYQYCKLCRTLNTENDELHYFLCLKSRDVPTPKRMPEPYKHAGVEFVHCEECGTSSVKIPSKCRYCGPWPCQRCGFPAFHQHRWWCGRLCSQGAWALLEGCRQGQYPLKPFALEAFVQKRMTRAAPSAQDLLDAETEETDMLMSLEVMNLE